MRQEVQTFNVDIHHEDGMFWADVQELPGCFASGESLDELWEALTEAVGMYLSEAGHQVEARLDHVSGPRHVDHVETRELAVCV